MVINRKAIIQKRKAEIARKKKILDGKIQKRDAELVSKKKVRSIKRWLTFSKIPSHPAAPYVTGAASLAIVLFDHYVSPKTGPGIFKANQSFLRRHLESLPVIAHMNAYFIPFLRRSFYESKNPAEFKIALKETPYYWMHASDILGGSRRRVKRYITDSAYRSKVDKDYARRHSDRYSADVDGPMPKFLPYNKENAKLRHQFLKRKMKSLGQKDKNRFMDLLWEKFSLEFGERLVSAFRSSGKVKEYVLKRMKEDLGKHRSKPAEKAELRKLLSKARLSMREAKELEILDRVISFESGRRKK